MATSVVVLTVLISRAPSSIIQPCVLFVFDSISVIFFGSQHMPCTNCNCNPANINNITPDRPSATTIHSNNGKPYFIGGSLLISHIWTMQSFPLASTSIQVVWYVRGGMYYCNGNYEIAVKFHEIS